MKKKLLVAIGYCLIIFLWLVNSPSANNDSLIKELLNTASKELGIEVPDVTSEKYPSILIVARQEVEYIVCKNSCNALAASLENLVYVADEVDLDTIEGHSILYHEMIHALQYAKFGQAQNCRQWVDREMQAYQLQDKWANKQGLNIPWLREIQDQLAVSCEAISQI